jgi:hypothetical protein
MRQTSELPRRAHLRFHGWDIVSSRIGQSFVSLWRMFRTCQSISYAFLSTIRLLLQRNKRLRMRIYQFSKSNQFITSVFFTTELLLFTDEASLAQFDLIPSVIPSPLTAENPPPPPFLLNPTRYGSRGPSPPPTTTLPIGHAESRCFPTARI